MSGHHNPPGPPPRCAAAIAAAAAIVLLAVSACTSTAGAPAPAVAAASVGPGGHPPTLTGSGLHVRRAVLLRCLCQYQQQHPAVTISYAAVGSSAGITAFSARQVNFGASDVPMTAAEQAIATAAPSPRSRST